MRITSLILTLCFFSTTLSAKDAWWLNAEFDANDKSILEIPVEQIDSSFNRASLLTAENVIQKYPEAKSDLADGESVFSVDWARDGKEHRIAVGVYAGTKEKGSFLLVVQKDKSKWKKIFLQKYPGKMGFGILKNMGHNTILYNECLECGHGRSYSLNSFSDSADNK